MIKKAMIMEILKEEKDIDRRGLTKEIVEKTGSNYNYINHLKGIERAKRRMKELYFGGKYEKTLR